MMNPKKTRLTRPLYVLAMAVVMCGGMVNSSYGQEAAQESLATSGERCQAIFDDVQAGISSGNVALLARHFAPQVDVSLRGAESGTFSSNQAFYVFEDFFRTRKFSRLRFSTVGEADSNPYATGSADLFYKGNRELVQVYVALMYAGEKHVITQLNIY